MLLLSCPLLLLLLLFVLCSCVAHFALIYGTIRFAYDNNLLLLLLLLLLVFPHYSGANYDFKQGKNILVLGSALLCSHLAYSHALITPRPSSNDCFSQASPGSGIKKVQWTHNVKKLSQKIRHIRNGIHMHMYNVGEHEAAWLFPFPTAQITERKTNEDEQTEAGKEPVRAEHLTSHILSNLTNKRWQEQINIFDRVMGKSVCIGSETVAAGQQDMQRRTRRVRGEGGEGEEESERETAVYFYLMTFACSHIYVNFHFHFHLDKYNRSFD